MMPLAMSLLLSMTPVTRVFAQNAAEHVSLGDRESTAGRNTAALEHYEMALKVNPRDYAALWKSSREAVDLGEAEAVASRRSALYAKATDYARRALAINPADAESHFHLSRALGRMALTLGVRERVKCAAEVRAHALRALELAPTHPGALHIMGVWNAEVLRLGGMQRLFAKTFLGGAVFESASWAEATRYMEQSVASEPDRLVHRLDLARVYRDSKRVPEARAAFQAALKAANLDPNDAMYRKAAETELAALR